MPRRHSSTAVATRPGAKRPSVRLHKKPVAIVTDVVKHLRSHHFREFPELPDRVLRLLASKATNTRLSIRANYRVWRAWCQLQKPKRRPYPASPADIGAFLQDQAPPIRVTQAGDFEVLKSGVTANGIPAKRYATLSRYLGTLSKLHIDGNHPDPTRDAEVLAVWRVLRRGLVSPTQKVALSFDVISQAVTALPDTLTGKRDRALLLLAYTVMARRSELVALNVENFEFHKDGSATVSFERLKTRQESTNYLTKPIVEVVVDWLQAAKIRRGPVFVRMDFAASKRRTRLTPQSVAIVFKRIARTLSLPELDPQFVSSHSARIGATQDLVEDGASDAAIMRDAGWKTPRMVGMYSRGAKAKQGAMATRLRRLAGDDSKQNE